MYLLETLIVRLLFTAFWYRSRGQVLEYCVNLRILNPERVLIR